VLTTSEIEGIVARIAEHVHPERVVLFGSYATGAATATSDVDLLVVMDTPLPQLKRAGRLRPFVDGYLVPVDVHVYTPAEVGEGRAVRYSFLDTVVRYGRTLYERADVRRGP
jgi:uncharacterized protein